MKSYYVESYRGWFVVNAPSMRDARREGVREFGRGAVREVRRATENEVAAYIAEKGQVAEVED